MNRRVTAGLITMSLTTPVTENFFSFHRLGAQRGKLPRVHSVPLLSERELAFSSLSTTLRAQAP
jgi:hypothetical protein